MQNSTGTRLIGGVALSLWLAVPGCGSGQEQPLTIQGTTYMLSVADGMVAEEFRLKEPSVYIPRGFPVSNIPEDLDELGLRITAAPPYDGPRMGIAHEANTAHWAQYYWNGTLQSSQRALWLYDRSLGGEAPYFDAFVKNWQGTYGPAVGGNWPWIAYYRDTANLNACDVVFLARYSFTTACTRDYHGDGHNVLGVAWGPVPPAHKGLDAQPALYIDPSLPEPYTRYNVIAHEMGHTLGLGHNTEEANTVSVMAPAARYPDNAWRHFSSHDNAQFRSIYSHGGD